MNLTNKIVLLVILGIVPCVICQIGIKTSGIKSGNNTSGQWSTENLTHHHSINDHNTTQALLWNRTISNLPKGFCFREVP